MAGPIGTVAGAVIGGLSGGLLGKTIAENIEPSVEPDIWRETYETSPYFDQSVAFKPSNLPIDWGGLVCIRRFMGGH